MDPVKYRRYVEAGRISGTRIYPAAWSPYSYAYGRSEYKTSIGHDLSMLGKGDVGGLFSVKRLGYTGMIISMVNGGQTKGTVTAPNDMLGPSYWREPAQPSTSALNASGTKLISSVSLTQPGFAAPAFSVELYEGGSPKMIGATLKERTNIFRKSGSEWLNYQFGWIPFVNDIKNLVRTARNHQKIVDQYYRDANRSIRRRAASPVVEQTRASGVSISPVPVTSSSAGKGTRTEYTKSAIWFAGRFRYWLPMDDSIASRAVRFNQYAERLLGLSVVPHPDQMWDIAPWSWLVDWFTDLGAVVHNISDLGTDGLVMEYGYVMCHTQYVRHLVGRRTDSGLNAPIGHTFVSETKTRLPGHPYGFGLTDSALSKRQLSILGALGLTQGHRGN